MARYELLSWKLDAGSWIPLDTTWGKFALNNRGKFQRNQDWFVRLLDTDAGSSSTSARLLQVTAAEHCRSTASCAAVSVVIGNHVRFWSNLGQKFRNHQQLVFTGYLRQIRKASWARKVWAMEVSWEWFGAIGSQISKSCFRNDPLGWLCFQKPQQINCLAC